MHGGSPIVKNLAIDGKKRSGSDQKRPNADSAGPENVRGDAKDWGEVHMWSRVAISPATAAMTAPIGSAGIRLLTWSSR